MLAPQGRPHWLLDKSGTARSRTLLHGLTEPQGMAFAKVAGHWVLNVADRPNGTDLTVVERGVRNGEVIQSYVNNHPPDEVVPVVAGRSLGWPYCNPDQDENHPRGSLSNIPFVADALANPGGSPAAIAAELVGLLVMSAWGSRSRLSVASCRAT